LGFIYSGSGGVGCFGVRLLGSRSCGASVVRFKKYIIVPIEKMQYSKIQE